MMNNSLLIFKAFAKNRSLSKIESSGDVFLHIGKKNQN